MGSCSQVADDTEGYRQVKWQLYISVVNGRIIISTRCYKSTEEPRLGRSVGWTIVMICKGCGFDPWSGHIQEATNECISNWNNSTNRYGLIGWALSYKAKGCLFNSLQGTA